jgi:hypothetical protein
MSNGRRNGLTVPQVTEPVIPDESAMASEIRNSGKVTNCYKTPQSEKRLFRPELSA